MLARSATLSWINPAGGAWSNPANWDPPRTPGQGDTARITQDGTYTVTLDSNVNIDALTLGAAEGSQRLVMNGRSLAFGATLTILARGAFTMDSGVLVGTSTSSVLQGSIDWLAGTLTGTLTVAAGSTLRIFSANDHDMPNASLVNEGTVVWSQGRLRGGGNPGTSIDNRGTWLVDGDVTCNSDFGGNGVEIVNSGTFRKTQGSLASQTLFMGGVRLSQRDGALDVRQGNLVLQGGGTLTGGAATVQDGALVLNSGPFTIDGTTTSSGVFQQGGNLAGSNTIRGSLEWIAGHWNAAPSVTLASNATLHITGGKDHDLADSTFVNHGTVSWTGGRIRGGGNLGTVVDNRGVWDARGELYLNADYGGRGFTFNNAGTLRKAASDGSVPLAFLGGVYLNQLDGAIEVESGNLLLLGGASLSGGVATNLAGTLRLGSGSFLLNGTTTSTNVILDGGNLTGTNVVQGGLQWIRGSANGIPSLTVAPSSTLWITSGNDHDLAGATVTNRGTVAWNGGRIRGGGNPGTVIHNEGLWDSQEDLVLNADFGGQGVNVINAGILQKSGGAANGQTLLLGGVFLSQRAGIIDVQRGSLGLVGGGTFLGGEATNPVGTIQLLNGPFTINGTVISGQVQQVGGGATLVGDNVLQGGFSWHAGSWGGVSSVTIPEGSTIHIATGNDHDLPNGSLTNRGTILWTGGRIRGGGGAGTVIHNDGLWEARGGLEFTADYSGRGIVFNNWGTLRKTSGGSTSQLALLPGVVLEQLGGLIDIQEGNVNLAGGGHLLGGQAAPVNGFLYLTRGAYQIRGTTTSLHVQHAGGGATLTGDNVIDGGLTWIAGPWNGIPSVTVLSTATLVIESANDHDLADTLLQNHGTVVWRGGRIRGGGGNRGTLIDNDGLWDCQGDLALNADYGGNGVAFNNTGTFRKSVARGTAALLGGVAFHLAGTLDSQAGQIAILGGFVPTDGCRLRFGVAGDRLNGSVSLPGRVTFKGHLSVNLQGLYWPAPGNSFDLISHASGTTPVFETETFPAPGYLNWTSHTADTLFSVQVVGSTGAINPATTDILLSSPTPGEFLLQWPGDHTGWTLQRQFQALRTGLSTTWTDVPGADITNQFVVPVDPAPGCAFYRLILR